jgi:mono/diheme cytochrome c family protein
MNFIRAVLAFTAASIALLQAQPAQTQGLPEGEGKDLTQQVCSTCHEIALVTAERHSEQQWKALVDDMVRRGAEASDSDKKVILAYLVKNFGK